MIDGCDCLSNGMLECNGLCGGAGNNGYNNSILIL